MSKQSFSKEGGASSRDCWEAAKDAGKEGRQACFFRGKTKAISGSAVKRRPPCVPGEHPVLQEEGRQQARGARQSRPALRGGSGIGRGVGRVAEEPS